MNDMNNLNVEQELLKRISDSMEEISGGMANLHDDLVKIINELITIKNNKGE